MICHGHAISHLKADIRGKLEPNGLKCGSIFILCYSLSEVALLVHTEGLCRFVFLSSVSNGLLMRAHKFEDLCIWLSLPSQLFEKELLH